MELDRSGPDIRKVGRDQIYKRGRGMAHEKDRHFLLLGLPGNPRHVHPVGGSEVVSSLSLLCWPLLLSGGAANLVLPDQPRLWTPELYSAVKPESQT